MYALPWNINLTAVLGLVRQSAQTKQTQFLLLFCFFVAWHQPVKSAVFQRYSLTASCCQTSIPKHFVAVICMTFGNSTQFKRMFVCVAWNSFRVSEILGGIGGNDYKIV